MAQNREISRGIFTKFDGILAPNKEGTVGYRQGAEAEGGRFNKGEWSEHRKPRGLRAWGRFVF